MIDGKKNLDTPIKIKKKHMNQLLKWEGYATGNLLDCEYFSKHYKLIAVDLSKKIELENPDLKQQINFIDRLDEDNATIPFVIEKSEETTF